MTRARCMDVSPGHSIGKNWICARIAPGWLVARTAQTIVIPMATSGLKCASAWVPAPGCRQSGRVD